MTHYSFQWDRIREKETTFSGKILRFLEFIQKSGILLYKGTKVVSVY